MPARSTNIRRAGWVASAVVAGALFYNPALAGSYAVLHQFTGGTDGAVLGAGVTLDQVGNIYGTTAQAGASDVPPRGAGTIYKSDPAGNITTLHAFNGKDGYAPALQLLLIQRTLYGDTTSGGPNAMGVIFSLNTDGTNYTMLHQFSGTDGLDPIGPLQRLPGHGLVGVTEYGGQGYVEHGFAGSGTLFTITRDGAYQKLHNFHGATGAHPNFVLTDAAGTIFGSTYTGGACAFHNGCGVIFRYDLPTQTYTVLYQFTGGADGALPLLGSIGPDGTLYGAAGYREGSGGTSSLFKLTPTSKGYNFTTMTYFNHAIGYPTGGPTLASDGTLVGVSSKALYAYGNGKLTLLHDFGLQPNPGGYQPMGQPTIDKHGIILGTTEFGGITPCDYFGGVEINPFGCGVLYRYVPGK